MISPQSIAIGAAAVGLVGKESDLFRFTVKHSFIMLFVICILTTLQAYAIPWIIPDYTKTSTVAMTETADSTGFNYLLILAGALTVIVAIVLMTKKKDEIQEANPDRRRDIPHD